MAKPTFDEAMETLLRVAESDTGQSRRVASFLLAWWNATTCGGFDITDLWALDVQLVEAMFVVMATVAKNQIYPETVGYGDRFKALVAQWRPHLLEKQG